MSFSVIKMVFSYGKTLKRGRAKYSTLHRYSLGGHQAYSSVPKSRSNVVSRAFKVISEARNREGFKVKPLGLKVPQRDFSFFRDALGNMVKDYQNAADVVVNRLIGMGQGVVDAAVERLEAATGVPVNELPASVGQGFASYVLTGLADGLSVSQAVQRAGRKAARYGRRVFRAVFARR